MPVLTTTEVDTRALYLDLLKKSLTRAISGQVYESAEPRFRIGRVWYVPLRAALGAFGFPLVRRRRFDARQRGEGRDWPDDAETMVGLKRLDNLQWCLEHVIHDEVPGDVIETGVWRGGASILMRGVLKAYGDVSRTVWVADSFRGLPRPGSAQYRSDVRERLWSFETLAVPVSEVRANFERYGLLDQQVQFLEGWFRDTLPRAPFERLALMRLDGDMYESTVDALSALYPKLSVGGFCIIDDYFGLAGARNATDDFRRKFNITDPLQQIDWAGGFWRRSGADTAPRPADQ